MNSPRSPIKLSCIIDDDDLYISLVKKIIDLKNLSENLIVFKNGQEALDYFKDIMERLDKDAFPEIILLDLSMPVMDGWSFLKEFTQIKSPKDFKTTLYIVSSSIDPFEIERAKSFSLVTDYLVKPIEMNQFEDIFTQISA